MWFWTSALDQDSGCIIWVPRRTPTSPKCMVSNPTTSIMLHFAATSQEPGWMVYTRYCLLGLSTWEIAGSQRARWTPLRRFRCCAPFLDPSRLSRSSIRISSLADNGWCTNTSRRRTLISLWASGKVWTIQDATPPEYLFFTGLIDNIWPHCFGGCSIARPTDEWLLQAGEWDSANLKPGADEGVFDTIPHAVGVLVKKR